MCDDGDVCGWRCVWMEMCDDGDVCDGDVCDGDVCIHT